MVASLAVVTGKQCRVSRAGCGAPVMPVCFLCFWSVFEFADMSVAIARGATVSGLRPLR